MSTTATPPNNHKPACAAERALPRARFGAVSFLCAIIAFSVALHTATGGLHAQVAPAARLDTTLDTPAPPVKTETAPADDDDIVELNPFVVSAREDHGYLAQNALGGSLLQSNLKDIAAATSTFTDQFMDDLAVNNIDDLALFMLSTEYDYGEDSGDGHNSSTGVSRTLRMRGLSSSRTINFFTAAHDADRFSMDRADQIRGPNALLFGFGNPGGIVNVSMKRAVLNKAQSELRVEGRSYDGLRYEFDVNQPLVKNKLGVRVAAMKSQQGSWRNWESNDQERFFGTLKWRLGARTEINVEGETGSIDKMTNRAVAGTDSISEWLAIGSPLSAAENQSLHIRGLGANPRIVLDTNSGTLMNWAGKTASALVQSDPYVQFGVTRPGTNLPITTDLLPKEAALYGPGFGTQYKYSRLGASFVHSFTKDWHFELLAIRTIVHQDVDDPQAAAGRYLAADTNEYLPDGTPNPNAGRPYLESTFQTNKAHTTDEGVRAMMKYTKDLKKWGRHTLAGSFLHYQGTLEQEMLRENIISPTAPNWSVLRDDNGIPILDGNGREQNGNIINGQNTIWRRTYVGRQLADGSWTLKGVPSRDIVMADWRLNPVSGLIDASTTATGGRQYEVAAIPFNNNTQMNKFHGMSAGAMLQSFFFKNRLVTTFGGAYDTYSVKESKWLQNTTYIPGTPPPAYDGYKPYYVRGNPYALVYTPDASESISGHSYAGSVVYHATRWLSLSYNRAANKGLPSFSARVMSPDGTDTYVRPPFSRGESDDIGIKFDLNKRMFATLLFYKTAERQAFVGSNQIGKAEINRIWNYMADNSDMFPQPPAGYSSYRDQSLFDNTTGGTCDRETKGVELELTANPTDNLRLRITYAYSKRKDTNIAPERLTYFERWSPLWLEHSDLVLPNGNTIEETVGLIEEALYQDAILADGREPRGQRRHQVRVTAMYDFSKTMLRGFSMGFNIVYDSKPVTGFFVDEVSGSGDITKNVYWGEAQCMAGIQTLYKRKISLFGKSYMWSLQVNVSNLFNDTRVYPMRVVGDGAVTMYKYSDPMAITVTSKIRF